MNKTLKAIATLSILFFLGSCSDNSNQDSLDSSLFGVWRENNTTNSTIKNFMISGTGKLTIWKENSVTGQFYNSVAGEWYVVGDMLCFVNKIENGDDIIAEYSISGNILTIDNSTINSISLHWGLPNGTYEKQ